MEKVIRFLPLGLFCLFSAKLMILGSSLTDSLVLLVMAAYSAYHEFKTVDGKIKALEEELSQQRAFIDSKLKEIDEVKALVGGIKLGQQIRGQINRS